MSKRCPANFCPGLEFNYARTPPRKKCPVNHPFFSKPSYQEETDYITDVEDSLPPKSKTNPIIPGCTDPSASNYNPLANQDDGTCVYDIPGCTDPSASNYNPTATVDDGSCVYPSVLGCMDPSAVNFNPSATVDDGSCVYSGCTDSLALNFNPLASIEDGSCVYAPSACVESQFQLDTRIEWTRIPRDFLWALEVSFPFNFYHFNTLSYTFAQFYPGAVTANTAPANIVLYSYRNDGPWNTLWDFETPPIGPLSIPSNPNPSFYTNDHWNKYYTTRWNIVNSSPNYGIERYSDGLSNLPESLSYSLMASRPPMTGFKNGPLQSISSLTSSYNSTIHYKIQFSLEETKRNTYMFYFRNSLFLPLDDILAASSGSDLDLISLHPVYPTSQFNGWSASDLSDFKQWASENETTPNPYFSTIGTCPIAPYPKHTEYIQYTTDGGQPPNGPLLTSQKDMIQQITDLTYTQVGVISQSPTGIADVIWSEETEWDGIPIDPTGLSNSELCDFIRPTGDSRAVLGLKQLYDSIKPFSDEVNPTPEEIDNWNIEVIRHFRNLLGNSSSPITPDARLYLEARWADERRYSTNWDTAYPPPPNGTDGPCIDSGGTPLPGMPLHCGASFFPSESDRSVYISAPPYLNDFVKYPELSPYTSRWSQTEGLSGADIRTPWSLKLAVIIGNWICSEGLTGHPGPYVGSRQYYGASWWLENGSISYRGKFR